MKNKILNYITEPFLKPMTKAAKTITKAVTKFLKIATREIKQGFKDTASDRSGKDYWTFYWTLVCLGTVAAFAYAIQILSLMPIIIYVTCVCMPTYIIAYHIRKKYR